MKLSTADALYKIIDRKKFPLGISQGIQRLKHPEIYMFCNDEEDAIVVYEPVFGIVPWYNTHTHTLKSCRGKRLRDFFLDTGVHLFENTKAEAIVSIIPPEFKRQGFFLRAIGAKRSGSIEDTNIYSFTREDIEEAKRKLKES